MSTHSVSSTRSADPRSSSTWKASPSPARSTWTTSAGASRPSPAATRHWPRGRTSPKTCASRTGSRSGHPRQARAIGYEFAPANDWDAGPVELTGEQVEELARREHGRWQDERRQAAWRYGPVRDAHAKLSPYLVPWDELTEDVRNLDRDAVRLIPTVLARAGYAAIPRPGQAGRHEPPRKRPPASLLHPRNRLTPHQERLLGRVTPQPVRTPLPAGAEQARPGQVRALSVSGPLGSDVLVLSPRTAMSPT